MTTRMTQEEKDKGLREILGLGDGEALETKPLTFSDNLNREPEQSFYEEPEDEDEDEGTPSEAVTSRGFDDQEEEPAWVKALSKKNEDLQAELRAQRSELITMRNYAAQQQQQQRQQAAPEKEEEPFWVTSIELKDVESRVKQTVDQSLAAVHRVAINQEYGAYQSTIHQLKTEMEQQGLPNFEEVVPPAALKNIFDAYARNPGAYGGYGQNWKQHLGSLYRQSAFDKLAQQTKQSKTKDDEMAKKREQKAVQNQNNLKKVAKSGSPVQEPKKNTWTRERRSYKSAFVRNQALKLIEGE